MNKNVDIFKVVDEMNKNKQDINSSIDDIYSLLDSINNQESVEDIKRTVNKLYGSDEIDENTYKANNSNVVKRPSIPKVVKDYEKRYELFVDLLKLVDYGSSNSKEYVKGHQKALNKYLIDSFNNTDDLYIVEGTINDELNKDSSASSLELKGYQDGLYYVYQALKESKRIFAEKIDKEIKKAI